MKALLLIAAAALAAANEKTMFAEVDAAAAQAQAAFNDLENCIKTHKTLLADYEKKRAELSKEFGGKIPSAFNDLLTMKRKRADRQQNICLAQYTAPDQYFQQAQELLTRIEPPGHPGVVERRKKIGAARQRYNSLISVRPPAKKAEGEPQQ